MKQITFEYEEGNKKWYLAIDGNMQGKFYDLHSAIIQLLRDKTQMRE